MPRPAPVTTATLPSSTASVTSYRLEHLGPAAALELHPERVDLVWRHPLVGTLLGGPPPGRILGLPPLTPQDPFQHLARLCDRERVGDAYEAGCPLGSEVGLLVEEAREGVGVEGRSRAQLQGSHHLVTYVDGGNRVHAREHDVGMAADDPLDRRGGEVLPVDAQPLVVPTGEVEPARLVSVREVAGPVVAVTYPRRVGLVVVPVALEAHGPQLVDQLADGLVGVQQVALRVELRDRALLAGVGAQHDGARGRLAERAGRLIGVALHHGAALGAA